MGQKCLVPKRKKKWPLSSGGTAVPSDRKHQVLRDLKICLQDFQRYQWFFTRCNFCRYFLGLPFIFDPIEMVASRQLLFDTPHTNQWWSPLCSSEFFVTPWLVKHQRKYVTVVFFHTIKVADSSHQVVASDEEQNVILRVSLPRCT